MGGYDKQGFLDEDVTWITLTHHEDFKLKVNGIKMNNHYMAGTNRYSVGFLDSGTTFTYFPTRLFSTIKNHFDWFCSASDINCNGI